MSVRVGVLLPTRDAVLRGDDALDEALAGAARAEELGFASVWAGDSLLARPRLDPLTFLAAVAARTRTVTIGTASLLAPLRQPVVAAHAIATLDRLAKGRLVLGVGAGFPAPPTEEEFAAANADYAGRGRALEAAVATWREVWRPLTDPGGASGLDRLPRPHREGGPPIWLAGDSPRAWRRAGELCEGWLPYPAEPERYAAGWAAVRQAAEAAGRDPAGLTPALYATVCLADDEDAARAEADAYLREYYGLPLELIAAFQTLVAGTPEQVTERLRAYVAAGARHIVLRFASPRFAEHLEAAARTLLPALG